MLLDFFGLGAKVFTPEQQHEANTVLQTQPPSMSHIFCLNAYLFNGSCEHILMTQHDFIMYSNVV